MVGLPCSSDFHRMCMVALDKERLASKWTASTGTFGRTWKIGRMVKVGGISSVCNER